MVIALNFKIKNCHGGYGHVRAVRVSTANPGFCEAAILPVDRTSTWRAKAAPRGSHTRRVNTPPGGNVVSPLDEKVIPPGGDVPTGVTVLIGLSAGMVCSTIVLPGTTGSVYFTIQPSVQGPRSQFWPSADGQIATPFGEARLTASLRA